MKQSYTDNLQRVQKINSGVARLPSMSPDDGLDAI
jgi:hypothetical protein